MKEKRAVAIIQARMGSARLPGKVMKGILNKPALWHVVHRVKSAKNIEKVIVATTNKKDDDIIYNFCVNNNILVCRGSENDVLDRYYHCARKHHINNIVRITADCPLHDPDVIDKVIEEYLRGYNDYVTNTLVYTFPDGLDCEVFSFKALETAWKNAKLPSEREHVTPYIKSDKLFRIKNVVSEKNYPNYRLTLDYFEDYTLIKKIYEGIGKVFFNLDEIVEFLDKNPELPKMNQDIIMNEGYLRSLIVDAKNSIVNGERIYLRALEEEDASQEYCNWLNDPTVNTFLETKEATIDDLKHYIKEKKKNPGCLFLGIFLKSNDKHVGNIKFEPIDLKNKKATLGILIGNKNWWAKGICTETVKLLVDYAFKKLTIKKIDLGVFSENMAAKKCYIKAGFSMENEAIEKKNGVCDKTIMSIEYKDYENVERKRFGRIRH